MKPFTETAAHEAGHAVVAYRFDHEAGKITIVKEGDILGSATTEGEWADGSTDREQIVVLFAGYAAEKMLFPNADSRGSFGDDEKAKHLLQSQGASERELRAEADRLVLQNRRQIEAVATALTEAKTLSYDEWTIIIDVVDENKDWRKILTEFRELFLSKE